MSEVVVIHAGVGNLGNLERALRHLGASCRVSDEPAVIRAARCLVLPGVGAFQPPRERLRGRLEAALVEALTGGAWLLGICVGYQLLFTEGEEFGRCDGLGLLAGTVRQLPPGVPLPHIGWNRVDWSGNAHPLFQGLHPGEYFYFVHGYAPTAVPEAQWLGRTLHGVVFPAVAGAGRILGTQFHPEKSGRAGLRLLANYLELAACS